MITHDMNNFQTIGNRSNCNKVITNSSISSSSVPKNSALCTSLETEKLVENERKDSYDGCFMHREK